MLLVLLTSSELALGTYVTPIMSLTGRPVLVANLLLATARRQMAEIPSLSYSGKGRRERAR